MKSKPVLERLKRKRDLSTLQKMGNPHLTNNPLGRRILSTYSRLNTDGISNKWTLKWKIRNNNGLTHDRRVVTADAFLKNIGGVSNEKIRANQNNDNGNTNHPIL